MEQERLMEVERDNRLLVSRIARTMAKGGLDNWNEDYEVFSKNGSVLLLLVFPFLRARYYKDCR